MIDLTTATARAVAALVRDRQISAVEVTKATLERVERYNPTLHAFITVTAEPALQAAAQVDRGVAANEPLPLAGVPIAIKDSLYLKGVITTAGSKALGGVAHRVSDGGRPAAGCWLRADREEFAP